MKDKKFKIRLRDKEYHIHYICTYTYAIKCVQKLLEVRTPSFGFDIETAKKVGYTYDPVAGLCPYRSTISLIQFYDGIDSVYVFDALELSGWAEFLAPIFKEKALIAHNAMFDKQHLMHLGIETNMHCTMIMYNMWHCAKYDSNEAEEKEITDSWQEEGTGTTLDWLGKAERMGASLRVVTAKLLGVHVEKDQQVSDWSVRPLSAEQLVYAAKDSIFTFEIAQILVADMKQFNMIRSYTLNKKALKPVCQMILNGIKLDVDTHKRHIVEWTTKKDKLHKKITSLMGANANIRSTKQISNWLEANLAKTDKRKWPRSEKTGLLLSNAQTLTEFSALPFVQPLLDYKKLEKMLNTYGQALIDKINPVTGRLHGGFTLGYTSTGRMSSRHPNFQNFPRDTSIKEIFIAEPGNILVGADYGQMELRVAALLSRDRRMLQAYKDGADLHQITAAAITGKKLESITARERTIAKSLNFGLLFGTGVNGLMNYAKWQYGVEMPRETAADYIKTFFKLYSGYANWQNKIRLKTEETGLVRTVMGKPRAIHLDRVYTQSVNHPVQGSAAEVVLTALIKLSNIKGARLINCVHDEFILEADEGETKHVQKQLKKVMIDAMLEVFPSATTLNLVDVKVGESWAKIK